MLKSARMKRFSIIVLDKYLDLAIREIGEFGYAQIIDTDIEKFKIKRSARGELYDRILHILRRINNIINILNISKRELEPISLGIENKSSEEILKYVENEIKKIEDKILEKSSRLNELIKEEEDLRDDERILRILKVSNINHKYLNGSEFLYTVAGFISKENLNELKNRLKNKLDEKFAVITGDELNERILVVILCMRDMSNELDRIVSGVGFERFELKTKLSLREVEKKLDKIRREKEKIISYLDGIKSKYEQKILAMHELIEIEKNNQNIRFMLGRTKKGYVLEGWIPEEKIPEFENILRRVTRNSAIFKYYDPKDEEEVPTMMKNPSISRPFETLTKAFGTPGYDEIDPTTIMAISFPVIYGMMFGDIGHGFMIFLIGIIMAKLRPDSKDIKSLGIIMMYCGILSMFFGFAYGEFFGQHEFYDAFITKNLGIKSFWINPLHEPDKLLKVAFMIGFVQMSVGIILKFINFVMNKKILHAITGPLMQEWILVGGFLLIASKGLRFGEWFKDPMFLFLTLGIPLLGILFSDVIRHIPHGIKIGELPRLITSTLLELYEIPVGLLANSISYSRILALALVHIGLFTALFKIADIIRGIDGIGIVLWSLIVILGTIVLVCFEGFIVFLHTLRLHYYEWFTKFYSASGVEYMPYKIKRLYTYVRSKS
ncbi:MAG: hypothetical protein DRO94_01360 [Candidatus Altiarchaeales archaeon]|nr:MAG: hypothetical protein DRO95_00535 [Candidatus Altiarchaeales archaeon]RLI95078.1 MAG: hypothetical protein DRO94_01360 [Candidatus Altiarchaeales archaeon]HDO82195.1 V-type ATP synthase subunit I [Candidatus Altiarchaeales archaeon]HEX54844.1 V-type ATP synthase subunit I [Candidatus Altiarchaeales archaeon]